MLQGIRAHEWMLGVLAVATFTMLFRLDAQPIQDWDEGIHGEVSFEMIEGGDWLTPHYMGGTYFRKPPLKIWMSASLFEIFGANAWTLRLPSALAGIATSLLVAWWAWEWQWHASRAFQISDFRLRKKEEWEAKFNGFLAGTIVATIRPIFSHGFRTGEMDGLLTFFVVVALYSWWRATTGVRHTTHECPMSNVQCPNKSQLQKSQTTRWFALCGIAIGLAVITKSAAGLFPLPIIAAHTVWLKWYYTPRPFRIIPLRMIIAAVLAFAAIVLPWHLTMTALHGRAFWDQYLGWHVIQRTVTALHNEGAGTWWYLPTLAQKFTPYVFWLVPALGYVALRRVRARASDGTTILFIIWFTITLALFTIAKTKFDWYLLPLYPAAVMLLIPFLAAARDIVRDRTVAVLHLAAIGGFTLALPNLFPDSTITDRIVERWYALFGHPFIITTIVLMTLVGIITIAYRRGGIAIASRTAHVIVMVIVMVPALTVTARYLFAREPANPTTAIAAELRGTPGVLVTYGFDPKQHPAMYFILRTQLSGDVRILDGQSDVRRTQSMLREQSPAFLLTKAETEIPEDLRPTITAPRRFGIFTMWERR